jgi:predicted DNA-binding transcriptional regulator
MKEKESLYKLGLDEDEIKVYTLLLRSQPLSASDLSSMSGLPLGRIYEIMDLLRRKKLVRVGAGRPITYTALPFKVPEEEKPKIRRKPKIEIEIGRGYSYLVKEEKPSRSFEIFDYLISENVAGLCITRTTHRLLEEKSWLQRAKVYWLGKVPPSKELECVERLDEVMRVIREWTKTKDDTAVLLDGLEYLINHYDFTSVLRLVHDLVELIASNRSRLIVPLDPRAVGEKEMALLARDMEVFTPEILYT